MAEKDIEKQTEANTQLERQISEKEVHSEKLASDILDTKGIYLKARDDPIRLDKNNENIAQGVGHLNATIADLRKKTDEQETKKTKENNKINDFDKQIKQI
jgi:hypothetical protein